MSMVKADKYFNTDVLEPVTLGIGGQQPIFITRDSVDGQLAFFCTKLAGTYKSTDGGKNWRLCENGLNSPATTSIQIDPLNKNHVVAVGAGNYFYLNGIYVSWDEGESWSHTLRASAVGNCEQRYQIAFDPTSYDEKLGGCAVIYWARSQNAQRKGHNHPALYKSTDGGKSWSELPNTEKFGNCSIRVDSKKGWLYLAGCSSLFGDDSEIEGGLWRSTDGGVTFEKIDDEVSYWLDINPFLPDNIYLTTKNGIKISTDCGDTFTYIKGENYPQSPRGLSLSAANPDNMILYNNVSEQGNTYFYTNDGGKKWTMAKIEADSNFNCAYHYQPMGAWSPDGQSVLSFGNDFILLSDDMGKNFVMSNNGFDAPAIISHIGYNINKPNIMFVATRNNGAKYSFDSGKSWKSIDWTKDFPGAATYGGYCWNEDDMCCGVEVSDNTVEIFVTHDGGQTIERTGAIVTGTKRCISVRCDDTTTYFGEWVTTNRGYGWKKMTDVKGDILFDCVLAHDYNSSRMWAVRKGNLLESYDCFETYNIIGRFSGAPVDVAYDHISKTLYVVMDHHIFAIYDDLQVERLDCASDMEHHIYINQIEVHPENPNLIYTTSTNRFDYESDTLLRSVDGGKSWTTLSKIPHARNLFINRASNEVFVEFENRGVFKMRLPEVE